MHIIRQYWTSVLVLVAVIASFVVSRADTRTRDANITSALVVACQADSKRTALNSAGFMALAERAQSRADPGDKKASRKLYAVASGVTTLIPAPIGREGDPLIAEVVLVDKSGVEPKFIITKRAQVLQRQGCEAFYGVG